MAAKKEKQLQSGMREIAGIVFLALCAITFLGVLSYTPDDIPALKYPPNNPPANLIGPVGAGISYGLFLLFGLATYLIPPFLLTAGLFGLLKPQLKIIPRVSWFFVGLLSLAMMLELSDAFGDAVKNLNLIGAGGVFGFILAEQSIGKWFGGFGAGIMAFTLFVISLVFITNIYPTSVFRMLYNRLKGKEEKPKEKTEEDKKPDAAAARKTEKMLQRAEKQREKEARRKQKEREKQQKLDAAAQIGEAAADPDGADRDEAVEFDLFGVAQIPEKKMPARKKSPKKPRVQKAVPQQPEEKPAPPAQPVAQPTPQPESDESLPDELSDTPAYQLPPLDILDPVPAGAGVGGGDDTSELALILQKTLNDFNIDASVTNVQVGPVVTSYEVRPGTGVRVEKIANLANNIALAMRAKSVRVQAPIPGKDVVGVEIPNSDSAAVYARQVMESDAFNSSKIALPLNLGMDVGGNMLVTDMAKMPHLLIAGATGAGKTVCMNSLLAGLLMTRSPKELRLMLVDPKIVEFQAYNDLPHLVVPVITDPKKVALGLRWAIKEMENRYKLFAKVGARNIESFNSRPKAAQADLFREEQSEENSAKIPDTVPYIVIVIDELADLMMVAQAEIENSIARLAQLSRATGIHMIIATQRPSVNVITGTIKANFPARIAFQVAQKVDSRTILDAQGAEQLLGKGDMLYSPPGGNKMIRAQGALTTDEEIARIAEFWKTQGKPEFIKEVHQKIESKSVEIPDSDDDDKDNDLLEQAVEVLRQTKRASTSSLQRRLRIGYNRAARLMDLLEEKGIVGPPTDTGPREILIDFDGEIPQNPNEEIPAELE